MKIFAAVMFAFPLRKYKNRSDFLKFMESLTEQDRILMSGIFTKDGVCTISNVRTILLYVSRRYF